MNGLDLILKERERHVSLGYTPEHDDEHTQGELANAALCYLELYGPSSNAVPPIYWPWEDEDWNPSDDPVENLVKAGSLIVAEIDRLLRSNA